MTGLVAGQEPPGVATVPRGKVRAVRRGVPPTHAALGRWHTPKQTQPMKDPQGLYPSSIISELEKTSSDTVQEYHFASPWRPGSSPSWEVGSRQGGVREAWGSLELRNPNLA